MWVRGTCATEAPLQDMATGIDEVRGTCAAEALVCAGAPLNIGQCSQFGTLGLSEPFEPFVFEPATNSDGTGNG